MLVAELRYFFRALEEGQTSNSACIAELEALSRDNKIDNEAGKRIIASLQKNNEQMTKTIEKYRR